MQLKQDEISAALNVSHIPVREALRRLESQGLVQDPSEPRRVRNKTDAKRVAGHDGVRATLSVMMLKNSAPKLTKEDFDAMQDVISQQLATPVEDIVRSEELNYKFHEILTSHAKNSMANLLLELVHANIDRYLRANFYGSAERERNPPTNTKRSSRAAAKGDFEAAKPAAGSHTQHKEFIPSSMQ
ncbi:MAG: GntR family transcriptional regulator [Eubacteriales bacterium]